MVATVVLSVVVLVVLVGLSAFFSSSETAVFGVSDEWVAGSEAGRSGAALRDLRADPHRLLVTILVGNNVVNVAIASITTALSIELLPSGVAVPVATLVVSVVVLIFGEIVPKSYGLGNAEAWSLRVALPLRTVERILSPLVIVFDGLTRRLNGVIGGEVAIERHVED